MEIAETMSKTNCLSLVEIISASVANGITKQLLTGTWETYALLDI